jgi:phage shock protein D
VSGPFVNRLEEVMTVSRTAAFRHRATPALKSAAKFIIINAITYGPLRILLGLALEPLLKRVMNTVASRFIKEKDEKTAN